jgi:hypothetical protein
VLTERERERVLARATKVVVHQGAQPNAMRGCNYATDERNTHTQHSSQGHLPVAVQLISFLAISAKAAGRQQAAGGKKNTTEPAHAHAACMHDQMLLLLLPGPPTCLPAY